MPDPKVFLLLMLIAICQPVFGQQVYRSTDAEGNVIYQATPAMVCESCAPKWFDGREA